ncbi:MAG TPA: heavy metal-associated domain-containing protein [Flavobacteriales bacterium]|nr:heavy metal-associated domain-containing protein [Flavobacteriales bacterium]HPH81763.1 heavy metal-associated domain-containing protein [Flavobacteriales bacterium]
MKTLEFSTSINCGSCVRAVTPTLDALVGANNWKVNTEDARKILSVYLENMDAGQICDALKSIGYSAEPLQVQV